jgi:hypothetical protein
MVNEPDPGAFRSAFLWTAGSIGGLSIVSTAGGIEPNGSTATLYLLWYAGSLVLVIAVIAGLVALGSHRGRAGGIFAGIAVGLLLLTVTCFVNLSTLQFG